MKWFTLLSAVLFVTVAIAKVHFKIDVTVYDDDDNVVDVDTIINTNLPTEQELSQKEVLARGTPIATLQSRAAAPVLAERSAKMGEMAVPAGVLSQRSQKELPTGEAPIASQTRSQQDRTAPRSPQEELLTKSKTKRDAPAVINYSTGAARKPSTGN